MAVFTRLIDGFWSARIVTESALDVMVSAPNFAVPVAELVTDPTSRSSWVTAYVPEQVTLAPGATVEPVHAASAALSSVTSNGPPRVTFPVLVSV